MLTDTDVKSVIDRKRNFFSTHSNEKHEEKLINVGLLILPIYPSQFIFTYSSENGSRFIFANYDVLLRITEKLKKVCLSSTCLWSSLEVVSLMGIKLVRTRTWGHSGDYETQCSTLTGLTFENSWNKNKLITLKVFQLNLVPFNKSQIKAKDWETF